MPHPVNSSGLQTADGAICNSTARVRTVSLIADGTNAASILIYDHASAASGTVLVKLTAVAGEGTIQAHIPDCGIEANNGIYADVTGTGAGYIVGYTKG